MNQRELLASIFPTAPIPLHVVEPTKDGLLLNCGATLTWPDDETGVVLLFDFEDELENEWWPEDDCYDTIMALFMLNPGPGDIQQRPRLRVVGFDEDENE